MSAKAETKSQPAIETAMPETKTLPAVEAPDAPAVAAGSEQPAAGAMDKTKTLPKVEIPKPPEGKQPGSRAERSEAATVKTAKADETTATPKEAGKNLPTAPEGKTTAAGEAYGVEGLERFTSGDLSGSAGEAAVIKGSKSYLPERQATLGKVVEEYFGGRKEEMPPLHTTDLQSLTRIGEGGELIAPSDGGASFSFRNSGTLRDGNVAIRVKPGREGNVSFVPDPNGTGLRPVIPADRPAGHSDHGAAIF